MKAAKKWIEEACEKQRLEYPMSSPPQKNRKRNMQLYLYIRQVLATSLSKTEREYFQFFRLTTIESVFSIYRNSKDHLYQRIVVFRVNIDKRTIWICLWKWASTNLVEISVAIAVAVTAQIVKILAVQIAVAASLYGQVCLVQQLLGLLRIRRNRGLVLGSQLLKFHSNTFSAVWDQIWLGL